MHVDGQVRRPDDNVGVVATGAVNSDGVDDIRRDDGGAGVGATDPCDSNSMMDVGRSDEYAGVGVLGFDNSYNRVESYQDGDVTGTLGEPGRGGRSVSTGPGISTSVRRAPDEDDPGIIGQASGVVDPGNGDVGDPGVDRVGDGLRRYTCDPNRGTGGPSIFGQASATEIRAMVESEMNRDVTYAIPTTERVSGRLLESELDRNVTNAIPTTVMDCEVKHAIPTTESDGETRTLYIWSQ